jgi:hypothetical protein
LLTLTFCVLRDCAFAYDIGEHAPLSRSEFQKDVVDVLLDRPITQMQFATDFFIC